MSNKKSKTKKFVKKNIKSSVFTHLFSIPKFKKELYLSLHPNDKYINEKDIKIYTLSSIFTNIQINDLGLLVKEVLLLLVEAQSTWTVNILPRMLQYVAESINRYVHDTKQNLYSTKQVTLPKPELYVLYTGSKIIKEKMLSFKKTFYNNDSPIEVKVNVITLNNSNKLIKEYIKFTKIIDVNNKKYGYTKNSINETIEYCIENNILRDYLSEYKKEVYNIMISVYDQKTATDMYLREQCDIAMKEGLAKGMEQGREEGIEEGIEQGIERGLLQGKLDILVEMVKDKTLSVADAAKRIGLSEKEFLKYVK